MKSLSLVVIVILAVAAGDDKECPTKVFLPSLDMLTELNKMMTNIQSQKCINSTNKIPGKRFEIKFHGFSGVINPLPEPDNKSSETCAPPREAKAHEPESLGYANSHNNGSYYRFHEDGADWWTANRTCEEEGAHLVVLDSDEEAQIVADIFSKHTNLKNDYNNKIFIGVSDQDEEGVFVTVLGNDVDRTGYAKWRGDNPDDWKAINRTGEDCVEMGRDKLLNDIHCNAKLAYVCEME